MMISEKIVPSVAWWWAFEFEIEKEVDSREEEGCFCGELSLMVVREQRGNVGWGWGVMFECWYWYGREFK